MLLSFHERFAVKASTVYFYVLRYPAHQSLILTRQRKLNMQPTEETILVINALILPEMLRIPKPYRIFKSQSNENSGQLDFYRHFSVILNLKAFYLTNASNCF